MGIEIVYNQPMKYAEMCSMLQDEEKKSTKSRQLQLNRWNKKYVIEKNKTWYTCKRELTKEEKELVNNENTFVSNIETILLNEIKENGTDYQTVLSTKELFLKLQLVNNKYYNAKFKGFNTFLYEVLEDNKTLFEYCINEERKQFSQKQASYELKTFFHETNNLLKGTLIESLKSMQKRNLIIFSKAFRLYKKVNNRTIVHTTTLEEDSIILGIINEVQNEMKVEGSIFFLTSEEKKIYYDKINNLIYERFGYDYCHEAIRIILSESAIKRDLAKREIISQAQKNNNKKAVDKLNKSTSLNNKIPTQRVKCFTHELIEIN